MNMIKSAKRNRLIDIIRALMMISCARPEDLKLLDFDDMAKDVAHRVWQDKKSKFWASERYLMSIVSKSNNAVPGLFKRCFNPLTRVL